MKRDRRTSPVATVDGRCPKCKVIWRWERTGASPRVSKGEASCPDCKVTLARTCAGGFAFGTVTIKVCQDSSVGRYGVPAATAPVESALGLADALDLGKLEEVPAAEVDKLTKDAAHAVAVQGARKHRPSPLTIDRVEAARQALLRRGSTR